MNRSALIVDDNRPLAEDLAEILESEGYDVCIFDDPQAVLAKADKLSFDVALIDVRMPVVDGVELQRRLREHNPDACYVMMTAYTEDDRVAQALASGVCAVLNKPVPLKQLFYALSGRAPCALLVVEDDSAFLQALCEALHEDGYDCHPAASAMDAKREAQRMLAERAAAPEEKRKPIALVVDVRLPDGDGASLAAELSRMLTAPVVIIAGADPELQQRLRASYAGVRLSVLEKPFSPAALLSALRDVIGERR
jgi:DNA-binding response OmpR family regulator